MNEWVLAALVLIVALLPCVAVALWASLTSALAAVEVAGALTTSALMLLAAGLQRQPFVDLALVLAFLTVIGSVVVARMMEADL